MTETVAPTGQKTSRAWYSASVDEFVAASTEVIVGRLATSCDFDLQASQRDAWLEQIRILKTSLIGLHGTLLLEFVIPRMGKRIDTVLLIGPAIFVIEFKIGSRTFDRSAVDQAWDYALDLKNFHQASHNAAIIPVLVASESKETGRPEFQSDDDYVFRPVCVAVAQLRDVLDRGVRSVSTSTIEPKGWEASVYKPTPTIVEAARALYVNHSVEAIARFDAGAQNLAITSRRVEQLVDAARDGRRKILCFVTGVPGAGKTLVGLNVATRRAQKDPASHAVFLSGNGPLVNVLREALARDEFARRKRKEKTPRKSKIAESIKAFIQPVHHFRDEALIDAGPPAEHVAIFDEAQRAWNLKQTANFMSRKKKRPGFSQSEPEFLMSCMDRHKDWAVVVCLVGGGQEINTGEAGISAWIEALGATLSHWEVHVSSRLTDSEYAAGRALELLSNRPNVQFDDSLHLAVPMRTFRAENMAFFVKALLACDERGAKEALSGLRGKYPIVVTRSLERAKDWLRRKARGTERTGLVASSRAQRLRPHAVDIRAAVNPVYWFLNDKDDVRSSYYLEDAATEFQVQGLEIDWACVLWDADLRFAESGWAYHDFRGSRWLNVKIPSNRQYLLNAYRVLLTRARQGLAIFVPPGDNSDPTRPPSFYDPTFDLLVRLGVDTID